MKNKIILSLLLISFIFGNAYADTILLVSPSSQQVDSGNNFTTDINIQDVTDLASFEVAINYNKDVINVSSIQVGSYLSSTGRTPIPVDNTFDNDNGVLSCAYATLGATSGPTGNGTLFTISWTAIDNGSSNVTFNSSQMTKSDASTIAHSTQNGSITVGTPVPVLQWLSTSQTINENAGNINISASMDITSTNTVTVPYTVSGSSSGADHNISNGSFDISAGQSTHSLSISIADDDIVESSETIIITLGTPTNASLGSNTTYTVTITDNDIPSVEFWKSNQTVDENFGSITIAVLMDKQSVQNVSIPYTVTGSATLADHNLSNGTLTIDAGKLEITKTITITNDSVVETNETIIITIGKPSNANLGSNSVHTITISNDDLPVVQWNSSEQTVGEDINNITIPLTMDQASFNRVTIPYLISGSVSGNDYNIENSNVFIEIGETSTNLTITINDDSIVENSETLIVSIGQPVNAITGLTNTHSITITDNDFPEVAWSQVSRILTENQGTISITATLDQANPRNNVTVSYTVTGTAQTGDDHDLTDGTITINKDETLSSKQLTINDDNLFESSETIIVTLSSPTNASLGQNIVQTLTISDNDTAQISWTSSTQNNKGEADGEIIITAELDKLSYTDVTANYTVGGSAISGTDHDLANGVFTIAAQQTSASITLNIVDDALDELDETVTLTLTNPKNANLGSTSVHTFSIVDNDVPEVEINNITQVIKEGEIASITLNMDIDGCQDILVPYSVSGSASQNLDHNLINGTITIPANSNSKSITFDILDDNLDENEESIIITINNPTNAVLGTNTSTTIKIEDNDIPKISWHTSSREVGESVDKINVTANLNMMSYTEISAEFLVSGSANSQDHDLTNSTINFPPNTSSAQITITIFDDEIIDDNENIIITLTSPTNAILGDTSVYTLTISENTELVVEWSSSSQIADEDAGTINISAQMNSKSTQNVTVPFTVSGTSQSGDDHNLNNGNIEIVSGNTSNSISINIIDDLNVELNETITITLGQPINADKLGSTTIHTITIVDNDIPLIAWSGASQSVNEGVGNVTINAILDQPNPRADISAPYTINGTAENNDHNLINGTLSIPKGQTSASVSVKITNDTKVELDETILITMGTPINANLSETNVYELTILDNDLPRVEWTDLSNEIAENKDSITIAVNLDQINPRGESSVQYQVTGSATSGKDYTLNNGTITIPSGITRNAINIPIINDTDVELNESIIVTLINPQNATLGSKNVHTITINDNDVPSVEWSETSQSKNEDIGKTVIIAILDQTNPRADVSVSYTVSGTASINTDHNLSNGTIVIPSGQSSKAITINIVDDSLVELDESVIVKMGNPVNASLKSITEHTITVNDNDLPKISVIKAQNVEEDDGLITITASLDQPNIRSNVTVSYNVNGTATYASDHDLSQGTITIPANETSKGITINISDDPDVEPNETVIITLNNPVNATLGAQYIHTLTIMDNDSPRIEWSHNLMNVYENAGSITITATLDKQSFQAINASYVVGGNATKHDLVNGAINIPANQTKATISFNIFPDPKLCKADESINITLTNPSNANLGVKYVQVINILEICPDFTTNRTLTVLEDSPRVVTSWAMDITSGTSTITSLSFDITNNNNKLFSESPLISNDGNLTFTPALNEFGSADVKAVLKAEEYISITKTFKIIILPVNDCPQFTMDTTLNIDEDEGEKIINNWTTNQNTGAANESGQALSYTVQTNNNTLFEVLPEINNNGKLRFKVKDNFNGQAMITVQLHDNGGKDNNGCDTSNAKAFTLTVNPINDPPVNETKPDISGILQVDQVFTGDKGSWNDNNDLSPGNINYSYQWQKADNQVGMNIQNISAANSEAMTLNSSLINKFIRLKITATDDGEGTSGNESTDAFSRFMGPVKDLPVVSFANQNMRVNEGDQVTLTVRLARKSDVDVQVPFTVSGDATVNSDHDLADGSININKGQTSAKIIINTIDDTETEENENIVVTIGNPTNAKSGGKTGSTIIIRANDFTPTISSINPSSGYADEIINTKIHGSNFTGGTIVTFNGKKADRIMVISKNLISCIVPKYDGSLSNDTDVEVKVINPGGNFDTNTFRYIAMKSISGRVTASSAPNGISNCLIEARKGNESWYTTSNESGYYTITELPAYKNFILSAWPDNIDSCFYSQYYNNKERQQADKLSTLASSQNNINFELSPCANGKIIGKVHDGNENTPADCGRILVEAFSESLGESGFSIAIPDGSYTISGLKNANDYVVSASCSQKVGTDYYYYIPEGEETGTYAPTESKLMANEASMITISNDIFSNIDIVIDPSLNGDIEGFIYDCNGKGMANVIVIASSKGLNIEKYAFTDRKGHYEITDLVPVNDSKRLTNGYTIRVIKKNFPVRYYPGTYNTNESIPVKTGVKNINIPGVGCGFSISGNIIDEDNKPVPLVSVLTWPKSGDGKVAYAESNVNGDYTITSLIPFDDYVVYVLPDNYKDQYYSGKSTENDADTVNIESGSKSNINFILSGGPKICGTVYINDTSNSASEGIPVNIWSKNTYTGGTIYTDSNGNYELRGLDPDANDYIISVLIDNYIPSYYNNSGTVYKASDASEIAPSDTCNKDIIVKDGFTISGSVTYGNDPIYRVFVEAYAQDIGWGFDLTKRILGSNENFVIKGLAPGTYEVTAEIKKTCYYADPQTVEITNQDVSVDIELINICSTIYGTVNNLEAGKSVTINAWSKSSFSTKNLVVDGPQTGNANIDYSITGLKPADDYIVQLRSQYYPTQYYMNETSWADADYVDISEGDQIDIDFTITIPSTISGNITFTNASAGDEVWVMAFSETTGTMESDSVVYPNTSYTITVKPASDYVVSIWSDKFDSTPTEHLIDASSNATGVDFTLSSGAEISGHLENEDGTNAVNVLVEAWSDKTGGWSGAETDSSGNYTIKGLPAADDYVVYVDDSVKSKFFYSTDGTVKNRSKASLISVLDGNVENIDIALIVVETISGTVVDEGTKPIANVWVTAWSNSIGSGNGGFTDQNGDFVITGLVSAKDYEVEVTPAWTSPYKSQKLKNISSNAQNLNFILAEGHKISGIITDQEGNPVEKVEVEIKSDNTNFYGRSKTNSTGYFEIKGLKSSSDYIILATPSGTDSYVPVIEKIGIINADTENDLELVPALSFSGYIKSDGSAVEDVWVNIFSDSNNFLRGCFTNKWGYYEIKNVPSGSDYLIKVTPDNYAAQRKINQTAGTEVNFELSSGGPISGYVRDSSGNPLSGIQVQISSDSLGVNKGLTTNNDGYFCFDGMQKYDLSGNIVADYIVYAISFDYPQQEKTNIKVDDVINFTLQSSASNILSGTVYDNTGSTPPSEKYVFVYLYKKQTSRGLLKKVKADANGQFEFTGLRSDLEYQLRFKILKGDNKNRRRWSGLAGPEQSRTNATSYQPGNDVDFNYDVAW